MKSFYERPSTFALFAGIASELAVFGSKLPHADMGFAIPTAVAVGVAVFSALVAIIYAIEDAGKQRP